MNEYLWRVYFVPADARELVDRTGELRVATTDPHTHCVYLSEDLDGEFLTRVLLHELGHCVMISYDLLDDIHRMVKPEYWVEAEEWICNFIADYGFKVFSVAKEVLGDDVWIFMPHELKKLVS